MIGGINHGISIPEVKNLNTPVPTGLNDYVWQHNYAVVETAVVGFFGCSWFSRNSFCRSSRSCIRTARR